MSSQGKQIYREGIQGKVGFLTNRRLPLQMDPVMSSHLKIKPSLKKQNCERPTEKKRSKEVREVRTPSFQLPLLQGVPFHQVRAPLVDLRKTALPHSPRNDTAGKEHT